MPGIADILSLLPVLKVLLILTGGAGGLSSSSPLSDMTQKHTQKGYRVSEINLQRVPERKKSQINELHQDAQNKR